MCCETLDWVLREMRGAEGGFCSALDADSEGVEGKFYVWTLDELRAALGPSLTDAAIAYFGPSDRGTSRARTCSRRAGPSRASAGRDPRRLLDAARAQRVRPGLDDKRLTSWNALMISALADAGAVLGREDYLEPPCGCAAFLLRPMRDARRTAAAHLRTAARASAGLLEDHAFLLEALLTLYEATFDDALVRRGAPRSPTR